MSEVRVRVDAGVREACVLVAAEREHSLVHLLGVEHSESHEKVEILDRQAGDGKEQIWFELGDHVLEGVLAEVGQVHERRDAGRELDQLLLDELPLGLVLLLLVRELLLLLGRQITVLGLALELFDLLALVDDRLDDVVTERAPALDALDRFHGFWVVEDAAQRVVVNVDQERGLPLASEQRR